MADANTSGHPHKMVLDLPADNQNIHKVNAFIHAELERRGCPASAQGQLDIALEEFFVNSCRYAYDGAAPDVPRIVRVTQAFSDDPPCVTVQIIDHGAPFDPLAKPDASTVDTYASASDIPVGGLGIFMAKQCVDEIRYERDDAANVITLVKRW